MAGLVGCAVGDWHRARFGARRRYGPATGVAVIGYGGVGLSFSGPPRARGDVAVDANPSKPTRPLWRPAAADAFDRADKGRLISFGANH